ncbi:MAG: FtsH protease activity modulator HflK [Deltaproteobacteria bacterium]|nr:MAG: FtsH protease activity modulator HflK [Deltaproteobacteria bacterium]
MAARDPDGSADAAVRRDVARLLANAVVVLVCLLVLGFWGYFGIYQLDPGQAAVILQFGKYEGTVVDPGLRWHWPPPLQSHVVVNVAALEREEFGAWVGTEAEKPDGQGREAAMQTAGNNIVSLGFVVQYRIKDAFQSRYRIAEPRATLRDAAQAAIREVVGRTTIDGLLSEQRGQVEREALQVLQDLLDRYESGLRIEGVQLQAVQPPPQVRAAFDDVIGARQDKNRTINEAQGYANEILPGSRAKAIELRESARAFRDATVAEATGQAARFRALATEYRKAPEVTRKRLYLETMERVLPEAEKLIIDPKASSVLPHFPIGPGGSR